MIARSPLPPRTTRLRPFSKKRRAKVRARRAAVVQRRELCGDRCEAAGIGVQCAGPLHPHEPLTRARGGSITDVDNIRMVCGRHHRWIHENPQIAERVGFLVNSWTGDR